METLLTDNYYNSLKAMLLIVCVSLLFLGLLYFLKNGGIERLKRMKNAHLKRTFKRKNARGLVFGKQGPFYVYSPAGREGHIFCGGGSGTGKTSALLIPTLRNWDYTSFTVDISGDISSNVQIHDKLVYEPGSAETAPYNIFAPIDAYLSQEDREEALAELAYLIMPELQNSSANADYYQRGGRDILTAALIWGYSAGKDFVEICDTIIGNGFSGLFKQIDKSKNAAAIRYINQFEGNNEQNTAGCKQNADRAVALFANNHRLKSTIRRPYSGETAFSCNSVEDHNVFIRIPDAKLELYAPLLHIITAQVLNYLADRPQENTAPILLALDEFVSLGKLEIGPALRKLRKKHVRIMVLTQSMADLDELYGRDTRMAFMNNFAFKVILSAGDTDSQKYYAELIGHYDQVKVSTTSGAGLSFSKTRSTEQRFSIEPEDLARLGDHLVLLYPDGFIRLRKNYYFKK